MDRSLWLLLRLRFRGSFRRFVSRLTTLKGLLTTLGIGLIAFFCMGSVAIQYFVEHQQGRQMDLSAVRRIAPLVLLAYCLLTVMFSEGAITFAPAEIDLLFPAPLLRRHLLAYKLAGGFFQLVLSSLFMSLFVLRYASGWLSSYLGLILTLQFLQSFAIAVALVGATVGALAYGRWRRIALFLLAALAVVTVVWERQQLSLSDWSANLTLLEESPILAVLLWPFRCLVNVFTAEQFWPDLVQWTGLAVLLNIACLGLVFALDAQYLEAAAGASERLYTKLQKLRSGGAWGQVSRAGRWRLSMLPTWGGAGPIAWRQMLAALRGIRGTIILLVIFGGIAIVPSFTSHETDAQNPAAQWAKQLPLLFPMLLYLPMLFTFDFRGDLDRIDLLKSLPVRPWVLALGEVLTPILWATMLESLILVLMQSLRPAPWLSFVVCLVFLPSVNAFLFLLENLFFLLMPMRMVPGDLQFAGKQMLVYMVKFLAIGIIVGICVLAAVLAYWLVGESWAAALCTAWLSLAAVDVALVPPVAVAFGKFDVSRDTPP